MTIGDIKHLTWIYDRLIHVHGEDARVDNMRKLEKIIDSFYKEDKVEDWVFVDKNIRREVLFNIENYEFEFKDFDGCWFVSEIKSADDLISRIKDKVFKYRYRLKPLEPIRVTKSFHDTFMYNYRVDENVDSIENGVLKIYNGRPVEIIEE